MRNILIAIMIVICLVGCGIKEKEIDTTDIATTSTASDTPVTIM